MSKSIKHKATKGILWSMMERFSIQGVQFFIMIILTRLLTPDDYGLIGMLSVFLAISQSLIDCGFSQALIRKNDRSEIDKSTVFYFNIVTSAILYLTLYISAPYIAKFYNAPALCLITRIACLTIVINSLTIVQRALLTIKIDFKSQTKISFISTSISGILSIIMAFCDFGVWALVLQSLVYSILSTILFWIISKWKPIKAFSWTSFHELFSFSSKLVLSGLIDTVYRNINTIAIGKIFSPSDLGQYTRAIHFSEFPSSNIAIIIQRVVFPILCEMQNDDFKLRQVYRKFIRLTAYIIFPLMIGLSAISEPLLTTLIGSQWLYCAALLQIICFDMVLMPIHGINLSLLQVKGRSDLYLRLELIKKFIGVLIIIIAIPLGIKAMCYGGIIISILCLIVNTYYTGKLIKVGFITQIKDMLPTIILTMSMFFIITVIINFIDNVLLKLTLGIIIGCMVYIGGSILFRFGELKEIISIIKNKK